ncbi:hypothetical protein J6590_105975 [Homalodisca vitripennis]|nr:hypothetical protein J6590_105975 [Homalodisca vitripennis]
MYGLDSRSSSLLTPRPSMLNVSSYSGKSHLAEGRQWFNQQNQNESISEFWLQIMCPPWGLGASTNTFSGYKKRGGGKERQRRNSNNHNHKAIMQRQTFLLDTIFLGSTFDNRMTIFTLHNTVCTPREGSRGLELNTGSVGVGCRCQILLTGPPAEFLVLLCCTLVVGVEQLLSGPLVA